MSIQRAYVNCRACYKVSNENSEHGPPTGDEEILRNSYRNNAMIALEGEKNLIYMQIAKKKNVKKLQTKLTLVDDILTACSECNFKKPNIARLAKKNELIKKRAA